jgi:hypothetical protein
MIADFEIVFPGKASFGLLQELHFLLDEIRIIDNAAAGHADQVVVMADGFGVYRQFITRPAVAEVEFIYLPNFFQEFQSAVNWGKAYTGPHPVHFHIYLIGAQVLFRAAQYVVDRLPRHGKTVSASLKRPGLFPGAFTAVFWHASFVLLMNIRKFILIFYILTVNAFHHFLYIKESPVSDEKHQEAVPKNGSKNQYQPKNNE